MSLLLDEEISDHSTINLNSELTNTRTVEYKRKLVGYSEEKCIENLLKVNWPESYKMNVNENANFLVDNIKLCLSIKNVRINQNNNKVWYNLTLYKLRKERDTA